MKKWLLILLILLAGCSRGDIQVATVIEGQPVPFDGYNVGPDIYVLQGQPANVTGVQIWINGLDPNDLLE